jgi:4-oxalocrotonate tautomerase
MPEKDKEKTMPHVIVKVWPGKTAQQKTRLAGAIAKDVIEVLHDGEESVSVAFEEVTSQDWAEKGDKPDMKDTWDTRSKKPEYTMCMARRGGRHAASYGGDLVARADHHIMGSA